MVLSSHIGWSTVLLLLGILELRDVNLLSLGTLSSVKVMVSICLGVASSVQISLGRSSSIAVLLAMSPSNLRVLLMMRKLLPSGSLFILLLENGAFEWLIDIDVDNVVIFKPISEIQYFSVITLFLILVGIVSVIFSIWAFPNGWDVVIDDISILVLTRIVTLGVVRVMVLNELLSVLKNILPDLTSRVDVLLFIIVAESRSLNRIINFKKYFTLWSISVVLLRVGLIARFLSILPVENGWSTHLPESIFRVLASWKRLADQILRITEVRPILGSLGFNLVGNAIADLHLGSRNIQRSLFLGLGRALLVS